MKRTLSLVASMAVAASISAADIRIGTNIDADTTWTSDNTYILDAQVYVIDGAELTIEPGTVIKGAALATSAASLVITRGSKIYALGTPSDPIIFTAESDPLDGSLGAETTSLWGGVIILGAAPTNSHKFGTTGDYTVDPQIPTTENIEGLVNSAANTWTEFGGLDADDSSGIFRYVSIRHGGSEIGAGNEINGLTMGGVGNGTIIEYVEVFANKDDAFEWFGGTVDARFLVAAYCNDESFDYDQGWTGRGQFWFTIGTTGVAGSDEMDHAGEHDGTANVAQAHPYRGMGDIFNVTYIGANQNEGVFGIEDDAGVHYYNSIFMDFAGHGIHVASDAVDGLTEEIDGVTRIDFRNNIWHNIGGGTTADLGSDTVAADFLTAAGKENNIQDPMLGGVSRIADGGLDPLPAADSPAFTNALKDEPVDGWFIDVDYQGAFGESNWAAGWSKLSQDGYLPSTASEPVNAPISLSTLCLVPDGDTAADRANIGFDVAGELPRLMIIRGKGKKLGDLPSIDASEVINPRIILKAFPSGEEVAIATDWLDMEAPIESMAKYAGLATLLADPDNSRPTLDDTAAALLISVNPGTYTIRLEDEDAEGGWGQLELYMTDL